MGASSEPAAPRSISRVATMDLTARARDSQPALANGLSAHNVLWAQSRPCGDGLSVRPGYVVECRVEAIRRLRNLVRESRFGPTTFRRVDTVIRTPYGPDSARWCCVTTARNGVLPSVPFSTKYEKVANVRLLVAAGLDGGASIVRHSPSRRTNYEARLVSTSLATVRRTGPQPGRRLPSIVGMAVFATRQRAGRPQGLSKMYSSSVPDIPRHLAMWQIDSISRTSSKGRSTSTTFSSEGRQEDTADAPNQSRAVS